ncbi:MAG: GNAT family N-acetyltransferase [Dehalococcoidales bacterium]|nr:GNAT family N-acetyltransferase [Dehalococcoidales bacterium]
MNIVHCSLNDVDLAVKAMKTIKCVIDNLPVELATPTAMQVFLANPLNYLLVAVEGERTLGYLFAYELQRPDRKQSMMFLYDITVLDEYRRKGVGTALIERLKTLCDNKHIMKMFVPTSRSNIAAVNLYQKTGAVISTDADAVTLTWQF